MSDIMNHLNFNNIIKIHLTLAMRIVNIVNYQDYDSSKQIRMTCTLLDCYCNDTYSRTEL